MLGQKDAGLGPGRHQRDQFSLLRNIGLLDRIASLFELRKAGGVGRRSK